MQSKEFFSEGSYINLPIFSKRVSLNVSSLAFAKKSIQLYNPFSAKAKILKSTIFFLIKYIPLFRLILSKKYSSGKFIVHLENKFSQKIHSSIYYPTVSDKIVLQLLLDQGKLLGYLKMGLNNRGNQKINNELQAIDELASVTKIVKKEYLIASGVYESNEYIIVKKIKGINKSISDSELLKELDKLNRNTKFILSEHPRLKNLILFSNQSNRNDLAEILKKISLSSKELYSLCYEHGDLAPWNIFVDKKKRIKFFDFEYFIKDGIENLDFFNYYYQIATKLDGFVEPTEILEYLKVKVKIKEFLEFLIVFLIHKILVNAMEDEDSKTEDKLLEYCCQLFLKNEKIR